MLGWIVVAGVSGSGKSAVGAALAEALAVPFVEGDDHHPPENVERMRAGRPLTDAMRVPWLDALVAAAREAGPAVVACSALRRRHRERLRAGLRPLRLVHLAVPREVLAARMHGRVHFMPAGLLDSQLAAAEPLAEGEGFDLDGAAPLDEVVRAAMRALG